MFKKILFIVFILFLSISVNSLLKYNTEITIIAFNHQIKTSINFLIFLTTLIILSIYLLFYILNSFLHPNLSLHKKEDKALRKKFDQYLNLISEAFIYKSARNVKESFSKLKKANKIFKKTNLSKLLESQLYYIKSDYTKSEESFKEIEDTNLNLNLLNLRINLEQAKKSSNTSEIKKYAEEILKIEPINQTSLETLFNIYIKEKEWEKSYKILQIAIKSKIFEEKKKQKEALFIYTSLGKKYYDNKEFIEAKNILRKAYKLNSNYIQAIILLIETYIVLGKKSKAINIIKKTWKNNTNPRLAELYFSLEKKSLKNAENLYKIHPKSYESNLILAEAYLKDAIYSKARKYAKIAEGLNETKYLYELMLKIEQKDNGNSTIINNLKQKILIFKNSCWKCSVCKREYIKWQPECNNCKALNSFEWSE